MKRHFILLFFALISGLSGAQAQMFDGVRIKEKCMPAVVCISTPDGTGSGFVVNASGYIVTNYHVIEDTKYNPSGISVEFKNGVTYKCSSIERIDADIDLALLKISATGLPTLPFYEGQIETGSDIAALGCPQGLTFNFTKGSVADADLDKKYEAARHLVQTNIDIYPGNSGGAMVNKNGQVVCVVRLGGRGEMKGINFSIPAASVINFLNRAKVPYSTVALLTDEELKTVSRELSPEELARDKAKNLARIENDEKIDAAKTQASLDNTEQEKRAQAEIIERAKRQKQDSINLSMQIDQLDAEAKKRLLQQTEIQQRERSAQMHQYDLARMGDARHYEILALEERRLNLRRAEDQQRNTRKAYYANLPSRISTRIGVGATYYLATLGHTSAVQWSENQIGAMADIFLGYRINPKGDFRRSRSTSIGLNFKLGAWNRLVGEQIHTAQDGALPAGSTLRSEHPFLEFGASFFLQEWLKMEVNFAQQQFYTNAQIVPFNSAALHLGFVLRIRDLELEAGMSTRYARDFVRPTFCPYLMLAYHVKWGKW